MENQLSNLATKIGLNSNEAYLNLELSAGILKILVIEIGTGGCTFSQMEILYETPLDDISLFPSLVERADFLQEILDAKAKIRLENPYFFDTVFYNS